MCGCDNKITIFFFKSNSINISTIQKCEMENVHLAVTNDTLIGSNTKIDKKMLGRSFSEKTFNQAQAVKPSLHEKRQKQLSEELKRMREEKSQTRLRNRQNKLDLIEKEKKIRKEIIEENNGWNSELEIIVANIGEKCAGFKWMHGKCVNYYNFWYHFIGITVIVLAAASGTGIVTQVSTCTVDPISGQRATNWVIILVTILMFLTSVASTIQQFKNWGQVSNQHQQTKSNYAQLEHDIRIALGVYRKDRQVGKDFVEWISKEFDNIEASAPPIPEKIQNDYNKLISGTDIAHNEIVEKILIKTHDSNSPDESPDNEPTAASALAMRTSEKISQKLFSSSDPPLLFSKQGTSSSQHSPGNSPSRSPTILIDGILVENNVEVKPDCQQQPQRKKSCVEIDVSEFESPFESDGRYKYEIQRFLENAK